jgi:hypothetical protein
MLDLLPQALVLLGQDRALDRLLHHREQHLGVDGLLDEAVGARLHGVDRQAHASVAGDHDDLRARGRSLESREQFGAVHVGQLRIHQHDLRLPAIANLLGGHDFANAGTAVFKQKAHPFECVGRSSTTSTNRFKAAHWWLLQRQGQRNRV